MPRIECYVFASLVHREVAALREGIHIYTHGRARTRNPSKTSAKLHIPARTPRVYMHAVLGDGRRMPGTAGAGQKETAFFVLPVEYVSAKMLIRK